MAAPTLTVAILAGGAATRLGGRDKGLEPLDGRALIAWVVDAIAGMEVWQRPSAVATAATPSVRNANVLIIANRHLEDYACHARTAGDDATGFRGPLAGIAAALRLIATPWLLTLPVDCPEPPRDLAARLLDHALRSRVSCVTAHDGERRQPLFALYRRELAPSAAAAVEAGQGVWQWQDSIGARELDFAGQSRQFQNLNTPEDFAAYAKFRRTC